MGRAGQLVDVNGDGKVDLRDAATQPPTALVAQAHKRGLFVHVFTFRNEQRGLASSYKGDPQAEYLQFFQLGVDGVFSEFPDTAVTARSVYCMSPIGSSDVTDETLRLGQQERTRTVLSRS